MASRGRWVAFGIAALGLVIVAAGLVVCWKPMYVMILTRRLQRGEDAESVIDSLQRLGAPGRRALLTALRSADDEDNIRRIRDALRSAIRSDLKAGIPVDGIIGQAVSGISLPDANGRAFASLASEGWAAGLLNDDAKDAIARRCLEATVIARDEYPLKTGGPLVKVTGHATGEGLYFRTKILTFLDGKELPGHMGSGFGGSGGGGACWSNTSQASRKPGRHTLHTEVEVTLDRLNDSEDIPPGEQWETTITTKPVAFNVLDHVPERYLEAEATPELGKLVGESVSLQEPKDRGSSHSHCRKDYTVSFPDDIRLLLGRLLPMDLAFKASWHIAELRKTYAGYNATILAGTMDGKQIQAPWKMINELEEPGEHVFTATITL